MRSTELPDRLVRLVRAATSSDRRLWGAVFVIVGLLMSCWALAAPYFSGPDEGLHASRAWSVVHGEILGADAHLGGFRFVTVPVWVDADHAATDCYRLDEQAPAGCFSLAPQNDEVLSRTAGSQLPFFYGLSGLPFLVASRGPGLLLVRLWGAMIASAFIASAAVTARRSRARRWLLPSVVVACPPMLLYIAAATNPSGLELAAAVSLWISAIVLATEPEIAPRVAVRLSVAMAAVMLSRQLGPLWVVIVIVFGAWVAGRGRLLDLARSRVMWWVAVAGAGSFAAWTGWYLIARPLATDASASAVKLPATEVVQAQIGRIWGLAQEAVGVLGWLDVRLPLFTYVVWIVAVLLLVVVAFIVGRGRLAWVPLVLLVVSLVVQLAGEFPSVSTIGFFWQGRYTLPMLIGVPLLSAYAIGQSGRMPRIPRRAAIAGGATIAVALFLSYFQMLRRYMVGAAGPLRIWNGTDWTPPIPAIVLLLGFAVATIAWVLVCSIAGVTDDDRSGDPQVAPASFQA